MDIDELLRVAARNGGRERVSGPRLRELRTSAGLSPTTLAAAIGVSERTLLEHERRNTHPRRLFTARRLERISHHLLERQGAQP